MYYNVYDIDVFSITKDSISHLWDYVQEVNSPRANSQYVVYVTDTTDPDYDNIEGWLLVIELRELKDGNFLKQFEISGDWADDIKSIQTFFANRQISVLCSYGRYKEPNSILRRSLTLYTVDLQTLELE